MYEEVTSQWGCSARNHTDVMLVFLGHLFNLNGTCFVPKCYAQHTREMSHAHQRFTYNRTRKIHVQSHKEDHVHLTWLRCSSSSLDCLSKQGPERRTREQRSSQDFSDLLFCPVQPVIEQLIGLHPTYSYFASSG